LDDRIASIPLPRGTKCPAVLSFDAGAELLRNVWLTREQSPIDVSQGLCDTKVGVSRVLDALKRLDMLERAVRYMKSKPGVWFATALEVAEHCQKILP
jgi:hypothetical protein